MKLYENHQANTERTVFKGLFVGMMLRILECHCYQ